MTFSNDRKEHKPPQESAAMQALHERQQQAITAQWTKQQTDRKTAPKQNRQGRPPL